MAGGMAGWSQVGMIELGRLLQRGTDGMNIQANWNVAEYGQTLGTVGPDGGVVLLDELYPGGARITLESGLSLDIPLGIVCGIGGWMVHTCYFSNLADATEQYGAMKLALVRIVDIIPFRDDHEAEQQFPDVLAALKEFIACYP